jgi:uncharacterized delta-60 repeat protein
MLALLLAVLAAQFGPGGATTTDFGREDIAAAVAVQPDGRLVVAGTSSAPKEERQSLALSRYHEDGSLDPSFGGDGTVTSDLLLDARDLLVQPDGRIVAVGQAEDAMGAVRYLADGTLDPSFGGGDGLADLERVGYDCRSADAVARQPDGKLVLVGTIGCGGEGGDTQLAVVRLNADGSLDPSFDRDRSRRPAFRTCTYGSAVALLPGGKILVGASDGGCYEERGPFRVARLNPDGTFDHAFGRAGRQSVAFPGRQAWVDDLIVDARGRILVVGTAGREFGKGRYRVTHALARLSSGGDVDRRFGRGGITLAPRGRPAHTYNSAGALLPDGRIVVVGTTGRYSKRSDPRIAVFGPDGGLDRSFRRGGAGHVRFGGARETADGVAVDPAGRVVVVGSSQADFALTRLGL